MLQDDGDRTEVDGYLPHYGYVMDPETFIPKSEHSTVLLLGLRRSGKTSIRRVVFHKLPPNETVFLESTPKVEKHDVSNCSFIKFQLWDCPGQPDYNEHKYLPDAMFLTCRAIIFVIDAQDDYHEALTQLSAILTIAFRCNMNIKVDVFIHKVDCLHDDQKIEIQRDITQKVMNAVEDLSCDQAIPNFNIGFHLTTIYDHSIFEAFSRVVQRMMPCLYAFEELLDIFISNSMVDKAFLFDVASKIYLATDTNVVDMQTYELCCDMIDAVVDVSSIYTPRNELVDPPFSEQTGATITLNNDTVLFLRGVNHQVALACVMHEEALEKMGLLEYNFRVIKEGLQKLLNVSQQRVEDHVAFLPPYEPQVHSDQETDPDHLDSIGRTDETGVLDEDGQSSPEFVHSGYHR